MDWTATFDGYCERIDPSFWSEPLNAVTNLAFIAAAIWIWPQARGIGKLLTFLLFTIGVGSGLFHTFATGWASLADTLPIGLFILVYLFAVHRDVLRLNGWVAFLATLGFFPFAAVFVPVVSRIPFLQISSFYWTVPTLLVIYGAFIGGAIRRGFLIGAGILTLSLIFRSLDELLCPVWPLGTHFMWHILNAVMLAWMIIVHARALAARDFGR